VNRTVWYRLAALAHARGEHGAALQALLQHATFEAGAHGRIRDVPRLINTYKAARGISERSAWRALKAACQRGWIRKTQGAAPGVPARYELQVPVDLVVGQLPQDLEELLRLWDTDAYPEPDDADTLHGHLTDAPITPVCLIPPHEHDSQEPRPENPANNSTLTECQTSPSYARAQFLLWMESSTTPGEISEPVRARADNPPSKGEAAAARNVLARCVPWWTQQRGPGFGSLSADQVNELVEPVAYALRRSTPSELIELLTVQTRSAESLPHVVGHRCWKLIKTRPEWSRRIIEPRHHVDEQGELYQALTHAKHQAYLRRQQQMARLGLGSHSPQAAVAAELEPFQDPPTVSSLADAFRASGRAALGLDSGQAGGRRADAAAFESEWAERADDASPRQVYADRTMRPPQRDPHPWRRKFR
jgi:hypothetical protein